MFSHHTYYEGVCSTCTFVSLTSPFIFTKPAIHFTMKSLPFTLFLYYKHLKIMFQILFFMAHITRDVSFIKVSYNINWVHKVGFIEVGIFKLKSMTRKYKPNPNRKQNMKKKTISAFQCIDHY